MNFLPRLCHPHCASPHPPKDRFHLPLVIVRGIHDGNGKSIPPTSRKDQDGSMWPRDRRPRVFPTRPEVQRHLDIKNPFPTPFQSFTTWSSLSTKIENWISRGVKNIQAQFVLIPLLGPETKIYRATGLVDQFGLKKQSYYEEEYLVMGHINAKAVIASVPVHDLNVLVSLPLFEWRYDFPPISTDELFLCLPTSIFGSYFPALAEDGRAHKMARKLKGKNIDTPRIQSILVLIARTESITMTEWESLRLRCIIDSMTRGMLFTVADWERLSGRRR